MGGRRKLKIHINLKDGKIPHYSTNWTPEVTDKKSEVTCLVCLNILRVAKNRKKVSKD